MPYTINAFSGNFDYYADLASSGAVLDFTTDDGNTVEPDGAGSVDLDGIVVPNATNAKPIFTDGATANTVRWELQVGAAIGSAPGDTNDAGLLSVDSANFSVDADGFMTLNVPVGVSDGGTGQTSLTDGSVLVGDGTNPVELIGPLTDGQLLIGDTAGVSPAAASLTEPAAGITITGGAGTITFALDDDLAALEGLSGTGLATRTAANTWTERSIAVTSSTGLSVSNGDGVAGNPTLAGVDATSSVKGVATFDENDFLVTAGDVALAERTRLKSPYVENLGIDYNGGTGVFSIQGAQAALSATNPGYVGIPSKADPGEINVYEITADQSFIDDVGASEIIGNLFGLTTSIAYAQDLPFFIYAVVNDDEDAVQFMISRIPHATSSPAAASIGAPDDAVADTQGSFWSLDNIDETLYDSNPCVCIGSFRMQMSASDDWTVQTLDNADGIMKYQEGRSFTFPTGQMGASTGTHLLPNGGTAPVFSSIFYSYTIAKNGYVNLQYFFDGDGGTDGAGAVVSFIASPYVQYDTGNTLQIGNGLVVSSNGATVEACYYFFASGTSGSFRLNEMTTAISNVLNSDFSNGSKTITGNGNFYISKA